MPPKIKPALIAAALLAISAAGIQSVLRDEGIGPTSTQGDTTLAHAYPDPAHGWQVPTICAGHTQGVFRGQTVRLAQCQAWLLEDASEAGRAIRRCTPVAMTQSQYDTLINLIINIGGSAYCSSQIARHIKAGNCAGAAYEMHAAPQIDRATGRPRIWQGRSIIDRETGAVLLAKGDSIKKWTTAGGTPMPGLILRRERNAAQFRQDCALW